DIANVQLLQSNGSHLRIPAPIQATVAGGKLVSPAGTRMNVLLTRVRCWRWLAATWPDAPPPRSDPRRRGTCGEPVGSGPQGPGMSSAFASLRFSGFSDCPNGTTYASS